MDGVQFIPDLTESIYSYFYTFNHQTLAYISHLMRVYILFFLPLKPRLFLERSIPYLNALPANQVTDCPYISGEISLAPITYNNNDTAQFDRNIKQFDHEVSIASEKGDNLLKYL